MKYSEQQLNEIARSMALGTHGSFAGFIGDAFMVADSGNRETLFKSFEGLFDRVARFKDIEPFNEAKHEEFIERRMNILDKKLMQGHISQSMYDLMVSEFSQSMDKLIANKVKA